MRYKSDRIHGNAGSEKSGRRKMRHERGTMRKKGMNALLGAGLGVILTLTSLPLSGAGLTAHASEAVGTGALDESTTGTSDAGTDPAADTTVLTDADLNALCSDATYTRGSVHDPSVVDAGNGTYYVFGSHMGVAKTTDFMNWSRVSGENDTDSTLFGRQNADGSVSAVSFNQAFRKSAYTGTVKTDIDGTAKDMTFGSYDASAWNTALGNYTVSGNMWAPDVVYNKTMNKWCMYLSLNGQNWNSVIILLTADSIEGPYVYQGPVVYSGFSETTAALSYKNTDLQLVYGDLDALPAKYDKADSKQWGEYWPHAIDPCVFYDENGNLCMSYGSWSGGIYELQLDETTGLRDYTVKYQSDFSGSKTINSDAYFGTKIAGGYYVSGEGSYIQHIGDYYYLFMSYGFYSPEGGYNMRIFRSKNPDGPFTDTQGNDARYTSFSLNYNADWGTIKNYEGERLMTNYQWDTMSKAECSQGHNSALTTSDGRTFVVYHTKFNDGTASHELRVHELFQDENGWIIASPYEYSVADQKLDYSKGVSASDITGTYQVIVNSYNIGYDASATNKIAVVKPSDITLNKDGSISGAYTGSWSVKDGTPYCTIKMGDNSFTGVFVRQTIDSIGIPTMCFTAVDETSGLTAWASQKLQGKGALALNVKDNSIRLPSITHTDITLPATGKNDTSIYWKSSDPDIISDTGKFTAPAADTDVTLKMTMVNGGYSYSRNYVVTAKAVQQEGTYLLASYFKNRSVNLADYADGSLKFDNPYSKSVSGGLDLSKGVSFSFDVTSTGKTNVLAAIFAMQGDGRLYFTPGSYLGYNATGGWYDANLTNYALVKDYIGDSAHVCVQLTPSGFTVLVNGQTAYTQSTLPSAALAGTLTDYTQPLNWLQNSAGSLIFGSGAWWSDTANCTLSNFNCYVGLDVDSADNDPVYLDGKKYVKIPSTDISLSDKKITLTEGDTCKLSAVLTPSDSTDTVTYTSAKPSVASVDETTGVVTAVKHGTTKITARTSSGLTATCSIKVAKAADHSFKLNKTKLKLDPEETFQLEADFKMDDQAEECTFVSSDTKVATVSEDGLVTAVAGGEATITVTSGSGLTQTCTVKVSGKAADAADTAADAADSASTSDSADAASSSDAGSAASAVSSADADASASSSAS